MTHADAMRLAIEPALTLLPAQMGSAAARAMLLAIAAQESDLSERRQRSGPARGYWQFERGGVDGVLTHHASARLSREVARRLDYSPDTDTLHEAIEHSDVLAASLARLLLWTLPQPLPERSQVEGAWRQYLEAWRPGRPHPDRWATRYGRAWREVSA